MRVNSLLLHVSGITQVKIYDKNQTYLQLSTNEYYDERCDELFKDFDIDTVSVQDNVLCIKIRPAKSAKFIDDLRELRENLESFIEILDDFEEKVFDR